MARSARSKESRAADLALGKRITRLRKERGFTQVELAEKLDVIQSIVSDYERGRLRPHHEMLVKISSALQVSTDELLGVAPIAKSSGAVNRRFLRRLQLIDRLPKRDQDALVRTIDTFLKQLDKAG